MDGLSFDDESARSGSPSEASPAQNGTLPDELRNILRTMIQNNAALISQNNTLLSIISGTGTTLAPRNSRHGYPENPFNEYQNSTSSKWADILESSAHSTPDFTDMFFDWQRPPNLPAVLNERRAWTSWSYKASFPHLATFLVRAKRGQKKERCPCQAIVDDYRTLDGDPVTAVLGKVSSRVEELWKVVRERHIMTERDGVSVRLWRIIDLSPVVLSCLLGSTPQLDLSYIAAFTERHLKLSNWGKISLLKFRDMSWSSYTFEYHFSFYYVTPDAHDREGHKPDKRLLRRSAPFGREKAAATKYIHEESLSFLLIGHFKDISTCIQLAESYFKYDPYARKVESHSFRQYNLQQSPALMLLSWISVGLHHVSWRWQSAIEAVDNEIRFSGQVVFMEDRTDLMADDPQFSLSKTYFWALQAYQLFEKTLLETIATWNGFKEQSLLSLQDGRVDQEEWQTSISDIDDAIVELGAKVSRIRTRIEEVKDLRTGLISASALFDSRTSVRQGENIRILTYITILFFPLSFVTSVFSMSFIGQNTKTAFAIALPAITLAAAVLVFNLQNLVTAWDVGTERSSGWLRHFMRRHRRDGWKQTAMKLHEDIAATKSPVTRARQQSSAWVYLVFLAEYLLVAVPVGEVAAAVRWLGLVGKDRLVAEKQQLEKELNKLNEKGIDLLDSDDEFVVMMRSKRNKAEAIREKLNNIIKEAEAEERKRKDEERGVILTLLLRVILGVFKSIRWVCLFLIRFVRTLFVPSWLLLLGVEYALILLFFLVASWTSNDQGPDDETAHPLLATELAEPSTSAFSKASRSLGLEIIFPPRQKIQEVEEDPDIMHVQRVRTQLDMNNKSPRVPQPIYPKELTKVAVNEIVVNNKRGGMDINEIRTDDMSDILKNVARSSNEVTRMVGRGAQSARSGLKPESEVRSSAGLENIDRWA